MIGFTTTSYALKISGVNQACSNLRNRKHLTCFHTVTDTRGKVCEDEKLQWEYIHAISSSYFHVLVFYRLFYKRYRKHFFLSVPILCFVIMFLLSKYILTYLSKDVKIPHIYWSTLSESSARELLKGKNSVLRWWLELIAHSFLVVYHLHK